MTQIFFDGDGTADNPYKIDSADIELIEEWTPICGYIIDCNTEKSFKGTFDGNGHTISGLTVNNPSSDYQGLFGYLGKNGTIKNLNLTNITVNGKDYVGGLVGSNDRTVTNCKVGNANISGDKNVGILVGDNYTHGSVDNCTVSDTTVKGDEKVGGLIGWNQRPGKNTVCNVTVSGKQNVDEFVGFGDKDIVTNCTVTKG